MPWPGQIGFQLMHALGVVPHAVAIDQPRTGSRGDVEHAAVDMGRDAGEHNLGGVPMRSRPVAPDHLVVPANAAGGHDHGLGVQFEVTDRLRFEVLPRGVVGSEYGAAHSDYSAIGRDQVRRPDDDGGR